MASPFATGASAYRTFRSVRARRHVLCIRFHQCILFYCEAPRLVCCRTQFRFSPSIARSQYSPIKSPLGIRFRPLVD